MRKSKRGAKLLALALCVAMALSLLCVPAMGAAPMMGETAVAETVPEAAPEHVGTMPEVPVSRPAVEQETAEVSSSSNPYVHNFTTDGNTSTFYTFSTPGDMTDYAEKLTGEYAQYTKGVVLAGDSDLSFTAPADGTVTVILTHPSSNSKGIKFYEDGETKSKPKMTGNPCAITLDVTAGKAYAFGKDGTKVAVLAIEYKTAHVHSFGEFTVTKQPSCTEEGSKYHICSAAGCELPGGKETLVMDKLPHTEEAIENVAATCVQDGHTGGTRCKVCKTVLVEPTVVPATGKHTYQNGVCVDCHVSEHTCAPGTEETIVRQPTCAVKGLKNVKCVGCDKLFPTEIDTIPHNTSGTVAHVEPNCVKAGVVGGTYCTMCERGKAEAEAAIPALGHKLDANGNCTVCGASSSIGAGGWFETIYAEVAGLAPANVTEVSYTSADYSGELDAQGLQYLIRPTKVKDADGQEQDGIRIDIPGVPAGTYTLTVKAGGATYTAPDIEVMEYDRSGYAHFNYTEGVGAYRDDGTLKANAIVIYVNEANKNTVELKVPDGTVVKGIGNILNSAGRDAHDPAHPGMCKRVSKGKTSWGTANGNEDVIRTLARSDTPLVVRIIGQVSNNTNNENPGKTPIDGLTAYNTLDYGGSKGDNGGMARMQSGKNITIEGIGPGACIDGWGLHFMAQTSDPDLGKSFEVRNLAFRNVPEDCIGLEGVQSDGAITAGSDRGWVHNCAFYAPKISSPAESDKDGGDGACDFKRGQYFTMSYCYYEGYHKTNLVGSSDDSLQYNITWHHNHWVNCDSRGPLGRQANIHIYNCIYEGQTSYCMNPRANCYIFSEYNSFLRSKNPMQIKSGAIKSYRDNFAAVTGDQDGTIVQSKDEVVTSANKFASFELDDTLSYIPSNDYRLDTSVASARQNIIAYAGPMKSEVILASDVDTEVVDQSRVPADAVGLPYDKDLNKTYLPNKNMAVDHIRFDLSGVDTGFVKVGLTATGQDIIFRVAEPVDISITDAGGTGIITLCNAQGETLLTGTGTAPSLPAGVYYLQSSMWDSGKGGYKEAKVSHLKIVPAAVAPHEHTWGDWHTTVESTCTRSGTQLRSCTSSGCTQTQTRTLPKLDHNYDANGVCTVCGGEESVAHTWGLWTEDTPSTCTEAGIETRVCSDCMLSESRELPLAPHTYVNGICSVCGANKAQEPDPGVAVDKVQLNTSKLTLTLGATTTAQLTAIVLPTNAADKNVLWKSSASSVVTVDARGNLTAVKEGSATITVTTADGGKTATCAVTVKPELQGETVLTPASFELSGNDIYAALERSCPSGITKNSDTSADNPGSYVVGSGLSVPGGTDNFFTVQYSAKSRVDPHVVTWTGEDAFAGTHRINFNSKVATTANSVKFKTDAAATVKVWWEPVTDKELRPLVIIDESGATKGSDVAPSADTTSMVSTFTLDSAGTYYLGSTPKKNFIYRVVVDTQKATILDSENPTVFVSGVTVGTKTLELGMGGKRALTATVSPADATTQTLAWVSTDPVVATVDATGVVTAEGPGKAQIMVTTEEGGKIAVVDCVVSAEPVVVVETGNLGAEGQKVTWELNSVGELSITNDENHMAQDDTVFVSLWDAANKFLGVKIIKTSELAAQVGAAWDHIKLIWVDSADAPKCQFETVTHTK